MCRVCVCAQVRACNVHMCCRLRTCGTQTMAIDSQTNPPSTLCHQPETAMSSSLHPPLLSLSLSAPSFSFLLVPHTSFFLVPPTPPHPTPHHTTHSCLFVLVFFVFHVFLLFLLSSCPLPPSACSSPCHLFLSLPPHLHPSLSDHALSAVFLTHGLSRLPSVCLVFLPPYD